MQKDSLQRFIFEKTDIRGEIVRLDKSFQTVMKNHHYPEIVFNILGQTLAASVLMSAALKFKGQFTIQFKSDSAIKLLIAKCTEDFFIRGLAQYDKALLETQDTLLKGGQLIITIEPDNAAKPYQSIIPLKVESIADNLENYFAQSVQIPTRIWFAITPKRVVGMLLQLLPRKEQTIEEREKFWEHAVKLGETITSKELLKLDNETILRRLYHMEKVRIFTPELINFRCNCNKKRMDNVIKMLGKKETEEIFKTKQNIKITCEYCNSIYTYDRIDVAALLHNAKL